MKLKQLQTSSLTGLSILALTSQPVAAANDGKSLPGAACHERFPGQANSVGRGVDGFFNQGTGVVTASCPIVRDGIISGRINSASVRVVDRSSNGAVSCRLSSV